MFTGIIERTVHIAAVVDGPGFVRLTLAADWSDLKLGDSIAVNGVCLTVADIKPQAVGFDVIPETLRKTNLGVLAVGDEVNVERSLRVGDRLDGHFVQGHVDATARLVQQIGDQKEWKLTVAPPEELRKFVVERGSVTIDGVSLTVASISAEGFVVALIPTTLALTTLGNRPIGWPFNFEADILAKTIIGHLDQYDLKSMIQGRG